MRLTGRDHRGDVVHFIQQGHDGYFLEEYDSFAIGWYWTVRGAKIAAAKLYGEKLNWEDADDEFDAHPNQIGEEERRRMSFPDDIT